MRLVLDTNSLIQCVSRRSRYHGLWLSFIDGSNHLCVTTEILNEYVEILQRETSETFASLVLEVILNNPHTLFINTFYKFNLITADPDDNKFIDCAVAAQAKYIVTEDEDNGEFIAKLSSRQAQIYKQALKMKTTGIVH